MQAAVRAAGLVALGVLSLASPGPARAALPVPAAARARLAAAIGALESEKAGRTPAERKISSRLLFASRMRRGEPAAAGVPALHTGVDWAADGTTLVDIRADVSPALLRAIEALSGTVVNAYPRYGSVRARLPEPAISALSQRPDVKALRPADRYFLRKVNTSQGDVAHRANALRSLLGVDGTGVTVGVLSDGVATLASRQASGDLPPGVSVLPGQAGSGDEGTAMLEIVYDLAPGASLLFATGTSGESSMATNIQDLRSAGADVIVDDVGYYAEAVFQDGPIAAAVDSVTADGALYFSAAGNGGNEDDGTSGAWEGDWLDSGALNDSGHPVQEFPTGHAYDVVEVDSPSFFTLTWSDPLHGSVNDYDLYLADDQGNIVAASDDPQTGTQNPSEMIDSRPPADHTGLHLVIVKYAGVGRDLHVDSHGGELEAHSAGEIYGHPGARGAIAVAATDWYYAGGPGGVFDGSESVEVFSSDGPRRVHYEADGTPITPGNLSSTGGELRAKPDLTAADCVSTSTPGFGTFCGTSAAAPHAAAIAALLLEAGGPGTTAVDVRAAMEAGTLDIEASGPDRDSGHGIVDAQLAADELLPEPDETLMLAAGSLLVAGLARRGGRT